MRTSWTVRALAALTLTVALGASPASADLLSYNLDKFTISSDPANDTNWRAQKFTTDGQSYLLKDVTLLMLRESGTSSASVEIYSNNVEIPGTSLHTLTSPGTYSGVLTETTFTSSGYILAPNSTYWVVLKANEGSGTQFRWGYTFENTGTGVGFSPYWAETSDSGSSWSPFHNTPYQMGVNVQAVPEPSSFALVGLGLGAMGYVHRRRKKLVTATPMNG